MLTSITLAVTSETKQLHLLLIMCTLYTELNTDLNSYMCYLI